MQAHPKVVLNRKQKAKTKVIFASLVVALMFRRIGGSLGLNAEQDQPAVQQLLLLIDELIATVKDEQVRIAMLREVQLQRERISSKAEKLDAGAGTLAALRVYTGDGFKSTPGTRFDFIRGQLRENLKQMRDLIQAPKEDEDTFYKLFARTINDI